MKHRIGARASQPLRREGAWCRSERGGSGRLDDWKEAGHHPMAYRACMQPMPRPAGRMHGHGPQCPSTNNHPSCAPRPSPQALHRHKLHDALLDLVQPIVSLIQALPHQPQRQGRHPAAATARGQQAER